jgi:hypothetical protein
MRRRSTTPKRRKRSSTELADMDVLFADLRSQPRKLVGAARAISTLGSPFTPKDLP